MSESNTDQNAEEQPKIVEGAPVEEVKGEDAAKTEKAPKEAPWFQKRIDEITAQRWSATREAEAARQRAEAAEAKLREVEEAKNPPVGDDGKALTEKDINELADKRARDMVALQNFNAECDRVFEEGKKTFDDFEQALSNYRDLGGLTTEFIQVALDTGQAPAVLRELGNNRDEAYRIMKLPPTKMAVEMTRLAEKLAKPKADPVSKAPEPIKPTRGQHKLPETDPDKMTPEEWMKWREKDLEDKKKNR